VTSINSIYTPVIQWEMPVSTSVTMAPNIGYNTGTSSSSYTFLLPGIMNTNDMVAVSGSFSTFTINRSNINQKIYWNGTNGDIITMANPGSSITVFCSAFVGSVTYLTIINYSGTFTLA